MKIQPTTESLLFDKAVELTKKMISQIETEKSEYVEVTRLMVERGKIYSQLDSYIKTLDRSSLSDNSSVKQQYDELMELDNQFRNLLKIQADRLRNKANTAQKDHKAHSSYALHQPKFPKNSLFLSSKVEG